MTLTLTQYFVGVLPMCFCAWWWMRRAKALAKENAELTKASFRFCYLIENQCSLIEKQQVKLRELMDGILKVGGAR
jgi:hypothetical protein